MTVLLLNLQSYCTTPEFLKNLTQDGLEAKPCWSSNPSVTLDVEKSY